MAYVLPLPSSNPLERPFAESLYMRSCSSFASQASAGTVRHTFPRSVSVTSVRSLSSLPNGHWLATNRKTPPRLASHSFLNLIHEFNSVPATTKAFGHISPKASLCNSNRPSSAFDLSRLTRSPEEFDDVWPNLSCETTLPVPILRTPDGSQAENIHQDRLGISAKNSCELQNELADDTVRHDDDTISLSGKHVDERPFKRWLSTLRRRNHQKRKAVKECDGCTMQEAAQILGSPCDKNNDKSGQTRSLSVTSSLGLITAVKSASMTLAGTSIAPHSHKGGIPGYVRSNHGSSGYSDIRMSLDSRGSVDPFIDAKARERSKERRNIVGEILESEESYIADMKALVNVCFVLKRVS
jgi:hypothetical protein